MGKKLMYSGHLDTVPVGNEKNWKFSPLSGQVSGGKIFGRGASDMKGGLASLTFAAIALNKFKGFAGEALFVFTRDEEAGFGGAKEVLKKGIRADACVIAEPNYEKIVIGCRGGSTIKITTIGKAAHTGSLKHEGKGIHAVLKMAKLLLELEKIKPRYTPHPSFPPPKVTPGTIIKGGVAGNVIPDSCEAMVNCRLSLGQTPETILEDIKNHLASLQREDPQLNFKIEEVNSFHPFLIDEKEEIVQVMKKNAEKILGKALPLGVTGGGTDGNIFVPAGIPSVSLGPASENYHAENEWVSIQSLVDCAKIYTLAALDYLG